MLVSTFYTIWPQQLVQARPVGAYGPLFWAFEALEKQAFFPWTGLCEEAGLEMLEGAWKWSLHRRRRREMSWFCILQTVEGRAAFLSSGCSEVPKWTWQQHAVQTRGLWSWKAFKGSHVRGSPRSRLEEGSLSSAGLYLTADVRGVLLLRARQAHPGRALDETREFQTAHHNGRVPSHLKPSPPAHMCAPGEF